MIPFTQLYIDGQKRPSSTISTFDVINPSTGILVGQAASATSEDCKAALESAAKAFETWEFSSLNERRAIFLKAAELVASEAFKKRIFEAGQKETATMEYWSLFDWTAASGVLRVTAGLVNSLSGETLHSSVPGGQLETQRRAMGVILSISPWNCPVTLTLRAIAIPIICGNTVVLKPSEYTPRSQEIVVDLFHEAGLPKGVLTYLPMSREAAPVLVPEIIAHPAVRKVNFTGSDRVGRIIAMEAAKYLKPCVLELGGKAPVIVLDDADISQAAKAIAYGAMAHSGQVCMSSERVVVQRGVADALITAVRNLCSKLKAGDPNVDPDVKLSPLFNAGQAQNVVKMIKEATEAGAQLLLGDLEAKGAVVQPHLVAGVKPGMRLWERESFGPVVGFAIADTIEEAIELANESEYSLSAAVWTNNVYSAKALASGVRAGTVNINGASVHTEPTAGARGLGGASGYGRFDIDAFTDLRVIVTHPLGRSYPLTS